MLCAGPQPDMRRRKARSGPAWEVIDLVLPAVAMTAAMSVRADDAVRFVNSRCACIRLLLGRWGMHGTSFDPLSGFWLLDVDIIPGGTIALPAHSRALNLLPMTGNLFVDGQELGSGASLMRRSGSETISISSDTGASLLLFSSGR